MEHFESAEEVSRFCNCKRDGISGFLYETCGADGESEDAGGLREVCHRGAGT